MAIGVMFSILGLAGGVFLGVTAEIVSKTPAHWLGYLQGEYQHIGWRFVFYLTTFLGGMFFQAVGIGLRSEKVRSASLALIVTLCLVITNALLCVQMIRNDRIGTATCAGLLCVICGFLFLTSTGCHATFRKFPPPPDQNAVTPAQLEEMRTRRRRNYD